MYYYVVPRPTLPISKLSLSDIAFTSRRTEREVCACVRACVRACARECVCVTWWQQSFHENSQKNSIPTYCTQVIQRMYFVGNRTKVVLEQKTISLHKTKVRPWVGLSLMSLSWCSGEHHLPASLQMKAPSELEATSVFLFTLVTNYFLLLWRLTKSCRKCFLQVMTDNHLTKAPRQSKVSLTTLSMGQML